MHATESKKGSRNPQELIFKSDGLSWKRKQSGYFYTILLIYICLVPFQFLSLKEPQEELPFRAAEVYSSQKIKFVLMSEGGETTVLL